MQNYQHQWMIHIICTCIFKHIMKDIGNGSSGHQIINTVCVSGIFHNVFVQGLEK